MSRLSRGLTLLVAAAALVLGTTAAARTPVPAAGGTVELVVRLGAPSLVRATQSSRALAAAVTRHHHLDVRAPASASYLPPSRPRSARSKAHRPHDPRRECPLALRRRPRRDRRRRAARRCRPARIGAGRRRGLSERHLPRAPRPQPAADRRARDAGHRPLDRGPGDQDRSSSTRGSTTGIRSSTRPRTRCLPGYPKGDTAYTTAKVIVCARVPAREHDLEVRRAPVRSRALGARDARRRDRSRKNKWTAVSRTVSVSGIAPKAYIGNYKALTVPTPGDGLDGNSPEIAAAIEAGVKDGMNVLNFSIGEPEVTPKRDVVVYAIQAASAAGVVCAPRSGNDFSDLGLRHRRPSRPVRRTRSPSPPDQPPPARRVT